MVKFLRQEKVGPSILCIVWATPGVSVTL